MKRITLFLCATALSAGRADVISSLEDMPADEQLRFYRAAAAYYERRCDELERRYEPLDQSNSSNRKLAHYWKLRLKLIEDELAAARKKNAPAPEIHRLEETATFLREGIEKLMPNQ